jgi:LCCL domain-containing protein
MARRSFAALAIALLAIASPAAGQNAPADTLRAAWSSTLENFPTAPGIVAVVCPNGGEILVSVWGTDEYTDDSGICVAAVHAGLLTLDGGVVVLERRPGRDSYQGSERHGVVSRDYPAWPRGYRFVRAATVTARPEDVGSIDGIIRAFYEVVSGPVGTPRQWDRDATLYLPGTTFAIAEEGPDARAVTPSDWSRAVDAHLVSEGFTEREIHRVTHEFGRMAHVWSTYAWETANGQSGRGINSIHLWNDGTRWWITHATWEDERPDNPIPEAYEGD